MFRFLLALLGGLFKLVTAVSLGLIAVLTVLAALIPNQKK